MLNVLMDSPAYTIARAAAPAIASHLARHRAALHHDESHSVSLLPDERVIESLINAAFWAGLHREEGFVPKISLAWLPPSSEIHPLTFGTPLPLDPGALAKLAPAVERPGIHLGVWGDKVWGTTRTIPPFCFVVEVVAPGLLVLKHRPRQESRKFVNVAVIEADRIKIIDESASAIADCPALLTSLLGFDSPQTEHVNVLVQLAVSMRRHGRGGALLVVPSGSNAWEQSIVHPIAYAVEPAYCDLADLVATRPDGDPDPEWVEAMNRAVDAIAGLTAVDGATIITDRYELLAFGAKIRRKTGGEPVDQLIATEPVEGTAAERVHPGQIGGTRHLSAAQFVKDDRDALALVASQDGHFTIFAWSPCEEAVHAHRVETLLL
jgi:hypothetical protein